METRGRFAVAREGIVPAFSFTKISVRDRFASTVAQSCDHRRLR
jgi:hypothetical protein